MSALVTRKVEQNLTTEEDGHSCTRMMAPKSSFINDHDVMVPASSNSRNDICSTEVREIKPSAIRVIIKSCLLDFSLG